MEKNDFPIMHHPVINLIKERHKENSQPGFRKDIFKLGLVLEGGGMRGVVSAAMASALHYLGLVEVFDVVYGSSAGALAGSLFITKNMPLGPTMYYDDLNKNDFIDLKRIFKKNKSIMNLDFLLHDILQDQKPLNWKCVLDSKIRLKIIVSSIKERKAICIDNYNTKEELFTLLKASANIPFIAGPPVKYKDDLLFDAAVYESIPYNSAIKDGCTHILALLTRPKGILRSKPSFLERYIIAKRMKKLSPGLEDDYLKRADEYRKKINFLMAANEQVKNEPSIYSIYLSEGHKPVASLEKNRKVLVENTKSGMKAVMDVFLGDEWVQYHEVLSPFNKFGVIPRIKV